MKFLIIFATIVVIVNVDANSHTESGEGSVRSAADAATVESNESSSLENVHGTVTHITNGIDSVRRSAAPILNELTGKVTNAFDEITDVVDGIADSLGNEVKVSVALCLGTVEYIVIELIQATNFVLATDALDLKGLLPTIDKIVANLASSVQNLLQMVVDIVDYCDDNPNYNTEEAVGVLQLILQTTVRIVNDVLFETKTLLNKANLDITDIVSAVHGTLDNVLEGIEDIVKDVANNVVISAGNISRSLHKIISKLNQVVRIALKAVDDDVGTLKSAIRNLTGDVASALNFSTLSNSLRRVVRELLSATNYAFHIINDAVDAVADVVQKIVGTVDKAVTNVIQNIEVAICTILSINKNALGNAARPGGLGDLLNCAVAQLAAGVENLVESILIIAGHIVTANLAKVLEKVVATVIAVAENVVVAVASFLNHVLSPMQNLDLNEIVSEVLTQLTTSLTIRSGTVSRSIYSLTIATNNLIGQVTGALTGALASVAGSVFGVVGTLAGVLSGVNGQLGCLTGVLKGLTDNVSGLVKGIANTPIGIVAAVIDVLYLVAENVANIARTFSGILTGLVKSKF